MNSKMIIFFFNPSYAKNLKVLREENYWDFFSDAALEAWSWKKLLSSYN